MIISGIINTATEYIAAFSQILAMIVIVIGMLKASVSFMKDSLFKKESREAMNETKMELGHSFSLGLGFLIGASILKTVVAPTWDDIGKLSAIMAIRTILNYFLTKDIKDINTTKQITEVSEIGSHPI
jgi:uncharacterized membrane protein